MQPCVHEDKGKGQKIQPRGQTGDYQKAQRSNLLLTACAIEEHQKGTGVLGPVSRRKQTIGRCVQGELVYVHPSHPLMSLWKGSPSQTASPWLSLKVQYPFLESSWHPYSFLSSEFKTSINKIWEAIADHGETICFSNFFYLLLLLESWYKPIVSNVMARIIRS